MWPRRSESSVFSNGLAVQASLPAFEIGLPAYYVLAFSEASSNLSRYDGMRYGLQRKVGRCASWAGV